MVIDKEYMKKIRKYYNNYQRRIPLELETIPLDRLGEEPELYEYSEQDLWEQSRKLINCYQTTQGRLEVSGGLDNFETELKAEEAAQVEEAGKERRNDF